MSEYVLKKEYETFKGSVYKRFEKKSSDIIRLQERQRENEKDIQEILDNTKWMKQTWTKALITMVCSVSGSVILGIGGLIWYVLTQ